MPSTDRHEHIRLAMGEVAAAIEASEALGDDEQLIQKMKLAYLNFDVALNSDDDNRIDENLRRAESLIHEAIADIEALDA